MLKLAQEAVAGLVPLVHTAMKDSYELSAPTAAAMGLLMTGLTVAWLAIPRKRTGSSPDSPKAGSASATSSTRIESRVVEPVSDFGKDRQRDRRPNMVGTLVPSSGLLEANCMEPFLFENDFVSGSAVMMHKPTLSPDLMRSGTYPFGEHLTGRKRLWEFRYSMKFKKNAKGLMVGLELDQYVPINPASKRLMGLTVSALRQVVGDDLYHSVGDDPAQGPGQHEKPVFMMPFWATDQFIVTPEGEEPPDLADPNFSSYGFLRANDRKTYCEELAKLDFGPGPTYTFGLWGISQFVDVVKWEITKVIPFKSIDFNTFCGGPPVSVVMYTLDMDGAPEGDRRHLQSRKNYYFRASLWSSRYPPSPAELRKLIPVQDQNDVNTSNREHSVTLQSRKGMVARMFGCCAPDVRSGQGPASVRQPPRSTLQA